MEMIAPFLLIIVAFAWGTSYAFMKEVVTVVPPFCLLTVRFGLSTVVLSIIYIKRFKNFNKAYLKNGGIIGFMLFLCYATSTVGLQFTTASKQTFLIASSVLLVPVFIWIFQRKRPDKYTVIGVIMATLGIGLLTIEKNVSFNQGDLLSVACAVACALHILTVDVFGKKLDPILLTIIQFALCTVILLVLAILFERIDFSVIWEFKYSFLYLSFAATIFTYLTLNSVQRYTQATTAALLLSTECVFGSLFAIVYLGERLTLQMAVGCIIIFAAIILQETKLNFIKINMKGSSGNDSSC